jgi:hypothetical protein
VPKQELKRPTSKPVTNKELRDYRAGKAVRPEVAELMAKQGRAKANREEKREAKEQERPYRKAWMEHRLSRPGRQFYQNYEFFNNLPMMRGEPEEVRERLWESYLENMVSGRHRRDNPSNPFWRQSGISPSQFDWQEWRATMGYKAHK